MRLRALTVYEACAILEVLGCGDDPMIYRGAETTSDSIYNAPTAQSPNFSRKANTVRIAYWSGAHARRIQGTLQSMVADRLRPDR